MSLCDIIQGAIIMIKRPDLETVMTEVHVPIPLKFATLMALVVSVYYYYNYPQNSVCLYFTIREIYNLSLIA